MRQQEKFIWADKLRVAATIGVITVHSSASIPPLFGHVSDSTWWTGHLIDCLARFCVPVFVMLSGALLLRTYNAPIEFYGRRFSRIVFPFLFWSLTYSLLQAAFKTKQLWQMSVPQYLSIFRDQLMSDSISYHFWYVYMIMGLYLVIPVAGIWIRKASGSLILGFTVLCFLTIACMDLLFADVKVPDVLRYIGYLPLGYYLGNLKAGRRMLRSGGLLAGSGFLVVVLGTFWISDQKGAFNPIFYGYASPGILAFSAGVFMLFRGIEWHASGGLAFFISRYSYGIYLVHVLVLSQIKFPWFLEYPLISIPLTVLLCLSASGLIVFCLNKLPGGKYISG